MFAGVSTKIALRLIKGNIFDGVIARIHLRHITGNMFAGGFARIALKLKLICSPASSPWSCASS